VAIRSQQQERGVMSAPRYDNVKRILDLAQALQSPGCGLSLDDIQARYGVGRRTAERMRSVVARLFPELHFEPGPDGRRYWKLRRGRANGLVVWTVDEIVALETATRRARESGAHDEERTLRSVAEKVRALIAPPGPRGPHLSLALREGAAEDGASG
jgi:predicted DNA-binding transcriptional regulator YafY